MYKTTYVLIFYIVVRSNIITSVHSFSISFHLQKFFYLYFIFLFCFVLFSKKNINVKKIIFLNFLNLKLSFQKTNISLFFDFLNTLIIIITLINILIFFLNKKININVYKYISIFIKILIINYLYFFYKIKINVNVCFFIIFINDIFFIITLMVYFFYKHLKIFIKTFHFLLVVIVLMLVDCCDIIFKKDLNSLENFYFNFYKSVIHLNISEYLYNF